MESIVVEASTLSAPPDGFVVYLSCSGTIPVSRIVENETSLSPILLWKDPSGAFPSALEEMCILWASPCLQLQFLVVLALSFFPPSAADVQLKYFLKEQNLLFKGLVEVWGKQENRKNGQTVLSLGTP